MTLTQQYLTEIKTKLIASPVVDSIAIVKERASIAQGYFRARLTLSNGEFLEEVVEYFVVKDGRCVTESYRYQWMDEKQQVLKKRWDNVEHFPNLPNFPHHVHVGDESNVNPGKSLSILELIEIVEQELSP